jgi:hypothetical protein
MQFDITTLNLTCTVVIPKRMISWITKEESSINPRSSPLSLRRCGNLRSQKASIYQFEGNRGR